MGHGIERIQPRGGAELLYQVQLSPEEAYVFTRITDPLTLEELAGICGKSPEELLPILERLERSGLVFLLRSAPPEPLPSPPQEPPPARGASQPVAVPRPAPRERRRGILPVEQVFGKADPLAGSEPLSPGLWLSRLYQAMIERKSGTFYLRYPDGELFALMLLDGAMAHYLCNRDDDGLRIGKILQKVSGLPDEEIQKALALQKEKGGRFGEVLIRMGRLTPKELQQALIFQFKWVLREMLLKGVPERGGFEPEAPREKEAFRFFLSPWMLRLARTQGQRIAQGGWDPFWKEERWRTNPLGVLGLKLSDLSAEERTLLREFSPPAGGEISEFSPFLRTLIVAGILEPVPRAEERIELPHWVRLNARTPFALLGLHFTALPHEIQAALEARRGELKELIARGWLSAEQGGALEKELSEAVRLLSEEKSRIEFVQGEASRDKRENMLHILVDQGMNALLLAQDYREAAEIGERLLRSSFDLPQHEAAARYILSRALEKLGKLREANLHAARLQELAARPQAPAEAHVFMAYYYRDRGNRQLAQVEFAKALAKNPALRAMF